MRAARSLHSLALAHGAVLRDRKSTRLNSSHEWSSYAVFCSKKKRMRLGIDPVQIIEDHEERMPLALPKQDVLEVVERTLLALIRTERHPVFVFYWYGDHRDLHSFPTRRSSDLDGWSMRPLLRDLSVAYGSRVAGVAPGWPALPVQYADFTLWQREVLGAERDPDSVLNRQLDFWSAALAGAPEVLALPADRPRPAAASHRGGRVPVEVPAKLHRAVVELARSSGATVFMVLQAALAGVLTRLGAGTDVPIAAALAGRGDEVLDDLVGFFINTLVLRTDTSGDPSFRELVRRVRDWDLAAYAHQDVPFDHVVERINPARSLGYEPLSPVMITLRTDASAELDLSDARIVPDLVNTGDAKMDLSLGLLEKAADGGAPAGVSGDLEYAPDLFDAGTAALIVECFLRFLAGAVGDPDGRIGRVAVLSADQRRRVLVEWNDTSSPVGVATLAELFAAQVARTPDGVALVDAGGSVSYRELDARASRWAGWLAARGVGPERFAGVALGRSVPAVVALLAVAKAGGAFLPLDVSYPVGRLR